MIRLDSPSCSLHTHAQHSAHVLSLRTSYRINREIELFANVQNLFDERYSTFGLYSDPTGVGPGVCVSATIARHVARAVIHE